MMRLASLFFLMPALASAQDLVCVFERECLEVGSCAEASFAVTVLAERPGVFSTGFGEIPVVARTEAGVWFAEGQGMAMLLTPGPDGTARLSAPIDDMGMVNYLGTCGNGS
jgi:hypothetical protein